jgi:hypothetical protein
MVKVSRRQRIVAREFDSSRRTNGFVGHTNTERLAILAGTLHRIVENTIPFNKGND